MPPSQTVQTELADILVAVVSCDRDRVTPDARLSDLGVDSLSIVEVSEALGARFDTYISDERINTMVTVNDAVDAVTQTDEPSPAAKAPVGGTVSSFARSARARAALVPAKAAAAMPARAPRPDRGATQVAARPREARPAIPPEDIGARKRRAWVLVGWLALAGVLIGAFFGVAGAVSLRALGIKELEPPPAVEVTAPPTPTPTPSEAAPSEEPEDEPEIKSELDVSPAQVSPGDRITFTGMIAEADAGATAQVQRRDGDSGWVDFPVDVELQDGGDFTTYIITSKPGDSEFRLIEKESGKSTPSAKVQIG